MKSDAHDDCFMFVYGVLMFAELRQALAGRTFDATVATLRGYRRYGVQMETFPAIVAEHGAVTRGLLLRDVDARAMVLFDAFEDIDDGLFDKQWVQVETADGIEHRAQAYIASESLQNTLSGTWNPLAFQQQQLSDYIDAIVIPFLDEFSERYGNV
jgi:gamma-glutamylcyclotransferase (GGCT)/AIG2-like uncharacterized protein YtfP